MSKIERINRMLRSNNSSIEDRIRDYAELAEWFNEIAWIDRQAHRITSEQFVDEMKLVASLLDEADELRNAEVK